MYVFTQAFACYMYFHDTYESDATEKTRFRRVCSWYPYWVFDSDCYGIMCLYEAPFFQLIEQLKALQMHVKS